MKSTILSCITLVLFYFSSLSQCPNPPANFINNPSFEVFSSCPVTFSVTPSTQCNTYGALFPATGWTIPSCGSPDYFNTCGYSYIYDDVVGNTTNPPPNYFPLPDGVGCAGSIKQNSFTEYLKTCLLTPMTAGVCYKFQADIYCHSSTTFMQDDYCAIDPAPQTFTLFGRNSCIGINQDWPSSLCPPTYTNSLNNEWRPIGSVTFTTKNQWQTISFSLTPTFNVQQIMFGIDCNSFPAYTCDGGSSLVPDDYYYVDRLLLNTCAVIFTDLNINESGSLCTNDLVLTATVTNPGGTYQWFKDGVLIAGQTSATLNVSALGLGAGVYTVNYTLSGNCLAKSRTITTGCPITLPVELVNFNATCSNNQGVLEWKTASETANDYFTIEKSDDGSTWVQIAQIEGAGTITTATDYRFIENDIKIGVNYYRLSQTDLNGKRVIKKIATTDCQIGKEDIKLYPNPAENELYVSINSSNEIIYIQCLDGLGRILFTADEQVVKSGVLNISNLEKGVYTVIVQTKFGERVERIMKK